MSRILVRALVLLLLLSLTACGKNPVGPSGGDDDDDGGGGSDVTSLTVLTVRVKPGLQVVTSPVVLRSDQTLQVQVQYSLSREHFALYDASNSLDNFMMITTSLSTDGLSHPDGGGGGTGFRQKTGALVNEVSPPSGIQFRFIVNELYRAKKNNNGNWVYTLVYTAPPKPFEVFRQ